MSKKKMFGAMVRREDVPSQAFHDHYRHPHGTMGLHIGTLREYVQSHQIHTDLLGPEQSRFEAIAELWFDHGADIIHFRNEPTMVSYLSEDERRFIDMKRTKVFIGEEEVLTSRPDAALHTDPADQKWQLFNRPLSIKLIQLIQPDADAKWYADTDEALGLELGVFRHVRCHPAQETISVAGRAPRPPDFLGVRELWWPTVTAFNDAIRANDSAWKLLIGRPHVHTLLAQAERWR